MVHWPDNMVTYIPEDRILFSNDAFGQHIASSERFDDELGREIIMEEAAKYYANIVLPYGKQVQKAIDDLSGLKIDLIAPSHGIIWRSLIPDILKEYGKWSRNETEKRAIIIYDSMWGSTERMAFAFMEGLREQGSQVTMRKLRTNHISDILTDLLTSRLILIGCPTLNNGMLPSMGAFLTYLKGLKPSGRIGVAFGSYGWGGQAVGEIEKVMQDLNWELPVEKVSVKYVPDDEELMLIKKTGNKLGKIVLS